MEAARWLLLLAVGFGGSQIVESADWDYEDNGPSTWPHTYPTCNDSMQSPVDIRKWKVSKCQLPPLVFKGHWNRDVEATLSNTGYSAEVTVEDWSRPASVSGGPLQDRYLFGNLHFHWGADSSEGSEHTLDHQRFSMEAHVVYFKAAYGNVTNAFRYSDGIAVVAFFLEVDDELEPNDDLSELTDAVPQIEAPESSTSLPLTAATEWFHDRATAGGYITYNGSLTTPPCHEVVTWIIYPLPVTLSEDQVSVFRTLRTPSGSLLLSNYRPTQPLYGRLVRLAGKARQGR